MQLCKTSGVFVTMLQKGYGGFGEDAEEVDQHVVWIRDYHYKEQLDKLGCFCLELWRLRGSVIEISKIKRG